MKTTVLILLINLAFFTAKAQSWQVVEATSQSWSGGVCCRSGVNYNIILESSDTTKKIIIDSVWTESDVFYNGPQKNFYVSQKITNNKLRVTITFGKSRDEKIK